MDGVINNKNTIRHWASTLLGSTTKNKMHTHDSRTLWLSFQRSCYNQFNRIKKRRPELLTEDGARRLLVPEDRDPVLDQRVRRNKDLRPNSNHYNRGQNMSDEEKQTRSNQHPFIGDGLLLRRRVGSRGGAAQREPPGRHLEFRTGKRRVN